MDLIPKVEGQSQNIIKRKNIAFMGSLVKNGHGKVLIHKNFLNFLFNRFSILLKY